MWEKVLCVAKYPASYLFSYVERLERENRQVPFTEIEINRLRFSVPIAALALWFDDVERLKIGGDAREKALLTLLADVSSRELIEVPVSSMLILPKELELAKRHLRLGFFTDVSTHKASEDAIFRSVFDFRMKGAMTVLQELYKEEPFLVMSSRDALNAKRIEALTYGVVLCATASLETMDDKNRTGFVFHVLAQAQLFCEETIIPAFLKT
jgi:hypothetical protein